MIADDPVFLGGIDRSGKTLMRLMLTTHPQIAVSRRMNQWFYFYGRYGDLRQEANFERCLAAMLNYKHMRALDLDAARVRREFWAGEPTYAWLFALFQRQYAEQKGKWRWGDQTGLIERYADAIFAAYPNARMIHMLRDPRDRYAAARARSRVAVGRSTAMWCYSAGLARRNLRRYPERYRVVRYEDLVRVPEATLRSVCAFLGEAYAPAMLSMAGERGIPEPKGPLTEAYIGCYQEAVSGRELAFLQLHAGRAMRAHGYTPDLIDLSGQRLHFALSDWPANFARMLAWWVREAVRQRFPKLPGRQIGPRRAVNWPAPS